MDRRKFVHVTGSCAAFISSAGIFVACKNSSVNKFENNLKLWSIDAFKRFEEIWNFKDFWKRGNTFDACLTFVDAAQQQWPDDPSIKSMQITVRDMLEENLTFFNSFDPGSLWADDFGWWGLMALNARKHLLKIGETELANRCLKLSTDLCWEYKKEYHL